MKLACVTFTRAGQLLAERLRAALTDEVEMFTAADYQTHLPRIFAAFDGVVFFAATGIAVRLIAPFLVSKVSDPAVVVVDDLGRYAISLVSGHLGGANALTRQIAAILNCQPIITTASDGRGFEALDLWAQRLQLEIENLHDLKTITALMVDGQPIQLIAEIPVALDYPQLVAQNPAGRVYVTSQTRLADDVPCCVLRPKNLYAGVGCRRGTSADGILAALAQVFDAHQRSLRSLAVLASIDLKHDEPGLLEAAQRLGVPLRFFPAAVIRRVQAQFAASSFVEAAVGVSGVCEPCAVLAANGPLIVGKTISAGVTVAIAIPTIEQPESV